MELKYVITNEDNFAIFDKLTNHNDVAKSLDGKPIGAGFCKITTQYCKEYEVEIPKVICYGSSHTLKIKSRKEDEEIINNNINKQEY